MKIGAVFTGGTIGSSVGEDGYISVAHTHTEKNTAKNTEKNTDKNTDNNRDNNRDYLLINMYYERYDIEHNTEFVIDEPYSILSENLDFEHIKSLVDSIRSLMNSDVDGIIVMHGTDTIQYSAGFLNYLLGDLTIPVILVSSAYVLSDSRANGLDNFMIAIEFIRQISTKGVFVSYKNSDGRGFIHCANRMLAHDAFTSDIHSMFGRYFAEYIDGQFISEDVKTNTGEIVQRTVVSEKSTDFSKVLFLHVYPGMPDSIPVENYDAILFESYHSGTGPTNGGMIKIADEARKSGKQVYIAGICSGVSQYETVKEYAEHGIQVLTDEAPISAYCRLCCTK